MPSRRERTFVRLRRSPGDAGAPLCWSRDVPRPQARIEMRLRGEGEIRRAQN
jgi:hypothetical protein